MNAATPPRSPRRGSAGAWRAPRRLPAPTRWEVALVAGVLLALVVGALVHLLGPPQPRPEQPRAARDNRAFVGERWNDAIGIQRERPPAPAGND